ncbi:hypothetical protein KJ359_003352 [Pestalotiopsis sp. 9143b]|nr:hypothetical protein KJ359_003352 [Pestalotiopsis sp. 9143b]
MHWVSLTHPEMVDAATVGLYENLKLPVVQGQHVIRTLETVLLNQDKIFKNQDKMHKLLLQLTGASADGLEEGGKRRKRKSDSLEEVNNDFAQSLRAVKEDYFDELWEIFVEYAKTNKVYETRRKEGTPVATGFVNEAISILEKKHGDDYGALSHLRALTPDLRLDAYVHFGKHRRQQETEPQQKTKRQTKKVNTKEVAEDDEEQSNDDMRSSRPKKRRSVILVDSDDDEYADGDDDE